jgi:hypothetical protein
MKYLLLIALLSLNSCVTTEYKAAEAKPYTVEPDSFLEELEKFAAKYPQN